LFWQPNLEMERGYHPQIMESAVWLAPGSVDTQLSFPHLCLEGYRAPVAERRVPAMRVLEAFHKVKLVGSRYVSRAICLRVTRSISSDEKKLSMAAVAIGLEPMAPDGLIPDVARSAAIETAGIRKARDGTRASV
jgi:hypothetical protein